MTSIGKALNSEVLSGLTLASATGKTAFLTKITLASLISAFALAGNSQEGVIGSMLVSPVGGPVMGLVAALLSSDAGGAANSALYLAIGFAVMIGVGMAVGKHFENDEPTHEMKRRYTHPDKYTAISAVIIGLCFGLVALSNGAAVGEGIGAGIAISLLPPAVNVGLTYMKKDMDDEEKMKNMMATLNITLYNMAGIAVACAMLFGMVGENETLTF
jgi:uncharacterized membrane protein